MTKLEELAELIFSDVTETIEDLEKRYPKRNLDENALVTRFAPSPTGFLHTGSLFTSLIGFKMANQSNGVFYTRLEDTDQKREIEGSGASLLKELEVFNIIPNEGYLGDKEDGLYGPYTQSKREMIYRTVIKEMIKRDLAYPCFCSSEDLAKLREEQEKLKVIPGYYREHATCRKLTTDEAMEKIRNGEAYIIRFKSKGNHENKIKVHDLIRGDLELSENDQDIVILKSDGLPTYHFAHLVDDHFMHTTTVTRGEEWLPSLPIHLELFSALNFETPSYAHLPVIMKLDNGNRRKLSKRKDNEAAVSFFLQSGYPIQGFIEYLMTIANSNYEEWRTNNPTLSYLDFPMSFEKMSLDGALFDLAKVCNICKEMISKMSTEEVSKNVFEYAKKYDEELFGLINRDYDYFKNIMSIEREVEKPRKDYEKYSDVKNAIIFFYNDYYDAMVNDIKFNENMNKEDIINILTEYKKDLHLDLSEEDWFSKIKELSVSLGFAATPKEWKKNKEAFKGHVGDVSSVIRVMASTRTQSQNLYYVLKILGKEEVERRIDKVLNLIK